MGKKKEVPVVNGAVSDLSKTLADVKKELVNMRGK